MCDHSLFKLNFRFITKLFFFIIWSVVALSISDKTFDLLVQFDCDADDLLCDKFLNLRSCITCIIMCNI